MYRLMVGERCFNEYGNLENAKYMLEILEQTEMEEVYILNKKGEMVEV